jgi:amidase
MDSVNNVFGRTLNPYKLSLGAGGSSGGEGALVSFRGSIIGVGTDIGGSIRAPSLCCGIYGFKPTANRVPCGNQESAGRRGSPGILPSAGPHAHCATDLTFFFKTVIKSEPWKYDSTALAIPWRDAERKKSLNIGVYLGDDDYPLDPPITRAMISAMKKLQSAHHSVQVLTGFPPLNEAMKTVAKLFSLDNKKTSAQFIRDGCEKPIAALAYTKPTNLIEDREYILDDIWDANNELVAYREKVFRVWRAHDLDVLLCPGSRSTAKPHDTYGIPIYTSIWNLLDVSV